MRHLKLTLAAILLSFATITLRGQPNALPWLGSYAFDHGEHHGTLALSARQDSCMPSACAEISAQYTDEQGTVYPARIRAFDERGQHLAFTVPFRGNAQAFDVYLVPEAPPPGQDASVGQPLYRLAGTTVSHGHTSGVVASRIVLSPSFVLTKAASPPAAARPVIGEDGEIATKNSDGSTTYHRLGVCGGRTVTAQGRVVTYACSQVPELLPADPPTADPQRQWLSRQDDALLSIIQTLLDSASYKNYLANYETNHAPGLYQQISDRTKYITQLTRTQ